MPRTPPASHGDLRLGALLFVASGACSLLYEIVWSRRLELTFGSTVPAVATVLSVYMAGLGLGAWFVGKTADARTPAACVRLYAWLELFIGLYGAGSLLLCDGIDAAHVALASSPSSAVLRVALSVALLLPPTLAMGATLPILTRALVADGGAFTQRVVAGLYAANTLGAVCGAGGAGFVLLARVGFAGTVSLAVAGNLLVALLAWRLGSRLIAPAPRRAAPAVVAPARDQRLATVGLVVAFLFGLVSLSLEVGWTRLLGLVFGSSSAGFALSLVGVLLGVALGSLLARAPVSPSTCVVRLAAVSFAAGAGTALSLLLWPALAWAAMSLAHAQPDPAVFLSVQLLLGTALVLPATTAFGAAFPLAARLAATRHGVGKGVGGVYLANTAGAVLGAGPVAVLGLDAAGVAPLIVAGAITFLLAGGLLVAVCRVRGRVSSAAVALAVVAVAAGAHVSGRALGHPVELWDLGPVVKARRSTSAVEEARVWRQSGTMLRALTDGAGATVSVRATRKGRHLTINGKVDASTHSDMAAQVLCGALPLLARPDAERVLVIGVGSGVTAAVAAGGPAVATLDVVEIEPEVVRAARDHFAPWNLGVFDDPKVTVTIADGRTRLATAHEQFDIIVSQPTNPWVAGVASLFTREFHALVRERLAPGGVAMQWVQLYLSDPIMCGAQVRTFAEAFPHVQVWFASSSDVLLLGSATPIVIDPPRADAALRANRAFQAHAPRWLAATGCVELLGRYIADRDALVRWTERAEVLTDERPRLEAMALANLLHPGVPSLMADLLGLRDSASPWPTLAAGLTDLVRAREALAEVFLLEDAPNRCLDELEPLRRGGALTPRGIVTASRALTEIGRTAEAERLLRGVLGDTPANVEARLGLIELLLAGETTPARRAEARRLLIVTPAGDLRALLARVRLGVLEARWGDVFAAATSAVEGDLDAVSTDDVEALVTALIESGFRSGRAGDVERALATAVGRREHDWYLLASWADVLRGCGRPADALAAFDLLERRWRVLEPWIHLGRARALLGLARVEEAQEVLAERDRFWPELAADSRQLLERGR